MTNNEIEQPSKYVVVDGDLLKVAEIQSAIKKVAEVTGSEEWATIFMGNFFVSSQLLKSELNAVLNI